MTTYKTRSKEFGEVWFSAPAATDKYRGYVWIGGPAFKDRQQVCYHGDFMGDTMQSTAGELKADAQEWLRDRAAWRRLMRRA